MEGPTVTLKPRVVEKVGQDFVIMELRGRRWHPISMAYPASTSAYARLGRLVHLDTKEKGFGKKERRKKKPAED